MAEAQAKSGSELPKGAKPSEKWIKELELAESDKDIKLFRKRGRDVVKKYLGETIEADTGTDVAKYNVFWSNVGVLKAALYANSPKPVVKREFDDYKDQAGRVAAIIMERLLRQPFEESGSELNEVYKNIVEDRLVPGLGQVWLSYNPKFAPHPEGQPDEEGKVPEIIVDEQVGMDYLYWDDFIFAPCRTWPECRWAGKRVWMTKEDFTERFGKEAATHVTWQLKQPDRIGPRVAPESFGVKKTEVFELWDKIHKKVVFVSKGCDYLLEETDDPLGLRDFFPFPKPMLATTTTSSIVPKSDYMMVQSQYVRLQDLTIRIKMLEDAIQASGVYDKANKELSNLLNGSKINRMIAVDNWGLFAEKGGIKGVIDWFPLEMIVNALDKLRELKAEAKQELYELTGISDIMRGVSAPRETATAQGLKAQYSSTRLQYIQGDVAEFVQESLRIKGEIICNHFQPHIIVRNSLIELTPDAEYAQEAVQILKDDWGKVYRVQIYADTLSIPDYNAERQGRTEFIGAMGQFISQAMPLVQVAPGSAPFLLQILQWGVASFRSAQSIEGVFTKMLVELENKAKLPPPPPPPDPALAVENIKQQGAQQIESIKQQGTDAREGQKFLHEQELARIKADAETVQAQAEMAHKERMAEIEAERDIEITRIKEEHEDMREGEKLQVELHGGNLVRKAESIVATHQAKCEAKEAAESESEMEEPETPDVSAELKQLMTIIAAPKEIVRDADGRPIGVKVKGGE